MAKETLIPQKNWQSGLSLVECNKYMLNNEIECDVKFLVGQEPNPELIPAHKLFLASRSSVMFVMFFGQMAETDTIRITDVKADIFKEFLMYLYTDQVTLTGDNVCHLMYTANKYDVGRLIKMCAEFLKKNIQVQNVCSIMENAHCLGVEELLLACRDYIVQNSKPIFKGNDLNNLCSDCLEKIISTDSLAEDETVVFSAVLTWAENCCKRQDLPLTQMNKRRVLGKLLYQVRFPLMNAKQFSDVADSGILSQEEQINIFKSLARGLLNSNTFPCKPRLSELICLRTFRESPANNEILEYNNHKFDQNITVEISQNVEAKGLVLVLPIATQPQNEVMVNVSNTSGCILQENYRTVDIANVDSGNVLKLYFKKPVLLAANQSIMMKITLRRLSENGKKKKKQMYGDFSPCYETRYCDDADRKLKPDISTLSRNIIQQHENYNKQLADGVVDCHGVQFTFRNNDKPPRGCSEFHDHNAFWQQNVFSVVRVSDTLDFLKGLIFSK